MTVPLNIVVEGAVDEVIVKSVVTACGLEVGTVYGKKGKDLVRKRISGYNRAAHHGPWLVVVDLDGEASCGAELVRGWLPDPDRSPLLCFRVAVRQIESWLLADGDRLSKFLGISASLIPMDPDNIEKPKEFLVDLARRSRKKALRDDVVPRPESGRREGSAYVSRMIEFVTRRSDGWRPSVARDGSPSLAGAMRCIENLTDPL